MFKKNLLKQNIALFITFLCMAATGIFAFNGLLDSHLHWGRVFKIVDAVDAMQDINSIIADVESGSRGYVITGDERFLEIYQEALERSKNIPEKLNSMEFSSHESAVSLKSLSDLIDKRLKFSKETVHLVQSGKDLESFSAVRRGKGREISERIRDMTKKIQDEESKISSAEVASVEQSTKFTLIGIVVGSILVSIAVLVAAIIINLDISARQRIEQKLRKSEKEAILNAKIKTEFLANMSHEIRTPMNGVVSMTGMLLETSMNKKQREYTEVIRYCADNMLYLINDILDFSKLEAGKMRFEMIDFEIEEILKTSLELFHYTAKEKGIHLSYHLESSVPRTLQGDPGRFRQVLTNLIGNAIKFTDKGEVGIVVKCEMIGDDQAILQVEVKDTGIGISEDSIPLLFSAFSQVDGSTARKFGGTGLGLAISKKIVEQMNGKIGVRSKENEGSTFWFTSAMRQSSQKTSAIYSENQAQQDFNGNTRTLRILLADDNVVNRRIAVMQIKKIGHNVDSVANGLEVLQAMKSASYDLVFMDCQMPEMDGYEATRHIRHLEKNKKRTLVIAMTANAMEGDREKCIESGMDDYISKPTTVEVLRRTLNRVI